MTKEHLILIEKVDILLNARDNDAVRFREFELIKAEFDDFFNPIRKSTESERKEARKELLK